MEQEDKNTDARDPEVKETEQIEIDGEQYSVNVLTSGKLEIEVPEGLDEAGREEFVSAMREKSKTVGSYYKKLHELKAEQNNPTWLKFKEAYDKGEITDADTPGEEKTPADPADTQPTEKPIWEKLGLKSQEEFEDWVVDNPVKYAQELARISREEMSATVAEELKRREADINQKAAESALEARVREAGHDPKEVKAYARFNQMPFGERAYELYRLDHAPKVDPAIEARLKAQREQVTFVDRGSRTSVYDSSLSANDLKSLSSEQLKARREHYMKLASG